MNSLILDLAYEQKVAIVTKNAVFEDISYDRTSDNVLKHLDDLLNKNNISIDDINEIVINLGPGSFTGLRVALSIAKGLGFKKDVTFKTFTSFDYLNEDNIILKGYSNFVYVKINGKMMCEEIQNLKKDLTYFVYDEELKNRLEKEGLKINLKNRLSFKEIIRKSKQAKVDGSLEPLYLRKSQAEISLEKSKNAK